MLRANGTAVAARSRLTRRALCGRSGRSRRALAMHKYNLAAVCAAVVGIAKSHEELMITARLAVVLAACGTRLGRQRLAELAPCHRSPSLPRCTDARSASQATPPANFSILASAVRRC
jgi:hypothetical protein